MSVHFSLNLYWLLLPLALGLLYWALHERASERSTSFMPSLGPLFRLGGAVILFMAVACVLLILNLWLR